MSRILIDVTSRYIRNDSRALSTSGTIIAVVDFDYEWLSLLTTQKLISLLPCS